ncbi:uncharacterized protein LOC117587483 [Drosophila guanche]|uniref:Ionotropic glutamate receptor C-terminal domain-containing protein n=1 Tax=Drosophila guanche TaxID=7266 RepID=A0A3B0JQG3_DROGU|nr:uncharacterized protein LOC117587483 [Drosophila guanche]SPP73398.1 Hypothetical predicted protein [Drosophila guanche]
MWSNYQSASRLLLLLLLLLQRLLLVYGIVNPANDTANTVIYMLPAKDLGPETWRAGVDCLDSFAQIFFFRNPRERFTRSYNLMLTNSFNLSMPADQIQEGFHKLINEAVARAGEPHRSELFQLRVISDHEDMRSKERNKNFGELLLADNYVIIVDTVERLLSLMSRYVSRKRSWNPGARFLVLFHNPQVHNRPLRVASQIFSELMSSFYVHRVALIYADSALDYNLLVNDYYSNVDCRILSVQSVGQCHDGRLFPSPKAVYTAMTDYISGFSPKNCTFFVCASISAPFVEADCILGIEMRILGFMRNRLQFTINQTCSLESRGEMDSSGNWNGLLGKLTDGECDFVIGGYYPDNEVADFFWGSDCYLQDAHTFYIKVADRRPAWQAMVGIFEPSTWIGFIVVLLISWLFWFVLVSLLPEPDYFQQISLTAINALAVSISVAVQERPVCQSTRLFFMALTLYGLNVVATYSSKMIATFQDPGYLHQLDELTEVMAAGIPFGGHEESRDWFENEDDMWVFNSYNVSPEFIPKTDNLLAVKLGQRCILSNRMYTLQSPLADDIFAFPQNFFTSPVQMIMKAGFPFLYEMNSIIRSMRDVGIFQKIDADFRYNNTYLNRIAKMRPQFAENAIVLTTEHLKGPFGILGVGVLCSSVAFLGELMIRYWPCRLQVKQQQTATRTRRKRPKDAGRLRGRSQWERQVQVAPVIRFTPVKRRKVL